MYGAGCEVKLILASIANNVPLYTFQLRYWRAIHAEVMTHRVFSRNASSSRAIPVAKMLEQVRTAPAGPDHWGKNEKGMQANQENNELLVIPEHLHGSFDAFMRHNGDVGDGQVITIMQDACPREIAWLFAAWNAASMSQAFSLAGYHKQVANRLTEPFQYINVVLTSSHWDNFFKLRCHPDAMPEFRMLAENMRELMKGPIALQKLDIGDWHIPYVAPEEQLLPTEVKLKLSTARCASVSFKTVEGLDMNLNDAQRIFVKLMGSDPLHASPTEHQARVGSMFGQHHEERSNFSAPWIQYRKFIEAGQMS